MDKQTDNPIVYYGKWRIPQYVNFAKSDQYQEFMGSLYYYGDKESVLELYVEPPLRSTQIFDQGDTIYGLDVYRRRFSLFYPKLVREGEVDFRKIIFSVRYFLITEWNETVGSPDDCLFHYCCVDYPSLRGWAFKNMLNWYVNLNSHSNVISWNVNDGLKYEAEIEEGIKLSILSNISSVPVGLHDINLTQITRILLSSERKQSIRKFLKLTSEFSRFLSLATFSRQSPSAMRLSRIEGTSSKVWEHLMFPVYESEQPPFNTVIKFDEIVAKKPEILIRWHENYEQMSPITKRLVQSVTEQKDDFDAPDFLIIAEALDGYFKRFENNRDDKDTRKYEDQITKLLKKFKGVTELQKCNLDAKILTDSRNKYSHLIPDDDKKGVEKAVSGDGLFYLTQQAIILLTCCVLDNLGLTSDEINICFKDSVIEHIVNDIPLWYREYIKQL